jgi:hypothetical protein
MSTGMTWDEVQDQLDLPSLAALTEYWESYPPVHVLVAGYFGIKPKAKAGKKQMDEVALSELMAMFPKG